MASRHAALLRKGLFLKVDYNLTEGSLFDLKTYVSAKVA
jgi:hypothetical protein